MIETFVITDELGIQKTCTKLENLKLWDKNPRSINEKDFDRLKKQLLKLGQYKPLLIIDDGTVLGGNMRNRGYIYLMKEYKQLGIDGLLAKYNTNAKDKLDKAETQAIIDQIQKGIWISIVKPKNENGKLEYALSDNDRAGFYDDDLLANLVPQYQDFDWADYAIDLQAPITLDETLYTDEGLNDEFKLPDGNKEGFQQMAFVLADEQAEDIKKAIKQAKELDEFKDIDAKGNENGNGNALYLIIQQWLEAKS